MATDERVGPYRRDRALVAGAQEAIKKLWSAPPDTGGWQSQEWCFADRRRRPVADPATPSGREMIGAFLAAAGRLLGLEPHRIEPIRLVAAGRWRLLHVGNRVPSQAEVFSAARTYRERVVLTENVQAVGSPSSAARRHLPADRTRLGTSGGQVCEPRRAPTSGSQPLGTNAPQRLGGAALRGGWSSVTTVDGRLAIWRRYDQWNEALAAVAEQQGAGGRPLYLQLDEEALAEATTRLGEEIAEPRRQLISLVRATMDIGPHAPPLAAHAGRVERWSAETGTPPPCLALLYVCSAAAGEMRAGEGMASANYYGRLAAVLRCRPEDAPEIARGYRNHAEALWGALNRWLEHHEGEKGLPTAFALRHRYAGLPMSQALVRRADRARLGRFFAAYGLPPRGQMSASDLEPLLDDWITSNPPPVSTFLRELWEGKGEARDRIAGIVGLELAEWDGSSDLPASDASRSGLVRLVGRMRSFPTRKLVLDLSVRLAHEAEEAVLDVVDAAGALMRKVLFARAADGSLTLATGEEVDAETLLGGVVRLCGGSATGDRKPRLLVPLRKDDLLQAFVEADRIQLGETSMLLALERRKAEVAAALQDCAAPGWEAIESLPGLPTGWVLFTSVEIFAPLDRSRHPWAELDALVPLGNTQLALSGGLRLPTKLRKWSTFRPPEIRAVLPQAQAAEVTVASMGEAGWTQTWSSDEGVILVDLAEVGLDDGDYIAQLRVGGRRDAVAESIIRLRSASTPNRVPSSPDIGYSAVGTGAFNAREGGSVRGAVGTSRSAATPLAHDGPLPPRALEALAVRRVRTRITPQVRPLVLGETAADSCVATGAHRIELPIDTGDRQRGWIHGTCRACGLVKRYPASHTQARRKAESGRSRTAPVDLSKLRPVQAGGVVDWQSGLDAMCHVGRGNANALERIGLQLEPSKLFVDVFGRTLELLGHVDVQRNPRTWRPEAWQMAPPALVRTIDGSWFLAGWRSEELVHGLALAAKERGADVEIRATESAPDGVFLVGADVDLASALCDDVHVEGQRIVADADAPMSLLADLPPLAQVAAGLQRVPRGDTRKVESWDPLSARWEEADRPRAGFMRLHGVVTTCCVMTSADLQDGVVRPVTPHLLKHIAGALTGKPPVAYDADQQALLVPTGCDLPGLIGRAMVLCSGLPPRLSSDGQQLVYAGVPEQIARAVYALLGGRP